MNNMWCSTHASKTYSYNVREKLYKPHSEKSHQE